MGRKRTRRLILLTATANSVNVRAVVDPSSSDTSADPSSGPSIAGSSKRTRSESVTDTATRSDGEEGKRRMHRSDDAYYRDLEQQFAAGEEDPASRSAKVEDFPVVYHPGNQHLLFW